MHPIDHDQVYYVLSGTAAYLYQGARVGIRQLGKEPLAIIISYPNRPR